MYKNNFLNGNDAQKLLFKTYSNKLTKVKRLSKKMYFYKEFDDNHIVVIKCGKPSVHFSTIKQLT